MPTNDYLIENRLYHLDSLLHRRFTESLFVLPNLLSKYLNYFPEYTEHREMHSLDVIEYCNCLMGEDRICQMNADELYVMLMACYLHDVGMGISEKDYHEFCSQVDFGDYFETHDPADIPDVIRAFHNDFSACFIRKYAHLFDFPSEQHTFAIMQTARGHRKSDLYDQNQFPTWVTFDNGNTLSLPYHASIVRLADEVDVAENRNSILLFDPENYSTETQRIENMKHEAIKRMTIYPDRVELDVRTEDPIIKEAVENLAKKLQKTLDYCRDVTAERTPYIITQKTIIINRL